MIFPNGPIKIDQFAHLVDNGTEIKTAIDHKKESTINFIKINGIEKIAEFIINLMDSHDGLLKNYEELIKLWQLEIKEVWKLEGD